MIHSIIWDFDGTLYDTYPKIAVVLQETLGEFHVRDDFSGILESLHVSMNHTLEKYSEKHGLPLQLLRQRFVENEENMDVRDCPPFEHAMEMVFLVRSNGGKNLICTNRGNSTFRFLDHYNHRSCFEDILTRESGHGKKPDPEPLLHLMGKNGLEKHRTLMVGDRDLDIRAARSAGIMSCYFDSHGIPSREKPDHVIFSLDEIKKLL
ncbi:MAG: HAD-IA family hydrolase [Clostridia bacterium]